MALKIFSLTIAVLISANANALRDRNMQGDDAGAVVVYDFSNTSGSQVVDVSGVAPALNLDVSTAGNLPTADGTPIRSNFAITNGYLLINPKPNGAPDDPDMGYVSAERHRTFFASPGAASKLNSCTSGFTIQAFLRPWFPFQGNRDSGNLIVGLSNSDGASSVQNPNFAIYQVGEAGAEAIRFSLRNGTGATSRVEVVSKVGAFASVRENDNPGKLTEVIATQEPNGVLTVYVNRDYKSTLSPVPPVLTANAKLVIGNELVGLSLNPDQTINVVQQRNWSGEIHHLAIYCRGFTRAEIVGTIMENKAKSAMVKPNSGQKIDDKQIEARKMVERLTGVAVPVDHPMVLRVQEKLVNSDRATAAKIITGDAATNEPGHPDFLNNLVKKMAIKMSNREETMRAPFNDFAASFIGITRDERSAQELLTEDFFYMADPTKANVRSDIYKDLVTSNNHYEDLENGAWDLGKVLTRVKGQQLATNDVGQLSPMPDPAGVITSRAFMAAHAIAGTNRRIVEYAFKEFMCIEMNEVADTAASPARIGRDIDRAPAGDQVKFETSCKGCHTIMDGFRGAFAKFDFASVTANGRAFNILRYSSIHRSGPFAFEMYNPGDQNTAGKVDASGTVMKLNHNQATFPNGYTISDDSFVNNATGKVNGPRFGWGGANKVGGIGADQFGRMFADSTRFSQCMAKRAFQAVCYPNRDLDSRVSPAIEGLAANFKNSGYKFRKLFQDVAAHPECAQAMGR